MVQQHTMPLSETVVNMVENLACRLAERHQGCITANHLMPYLPLSLELLRACLDHMVDGHTVYATTKDQLLVYEFPAYRDTAAQPGVLHVRSCVGCNTTFPPNRKRVLCTPCLTRLRKALRRMAKQSNWTEQALYEHEMLYTASQHADPLPAATLASRSSTTLRDIQQTLERLSLDGYVRQDVDLETGVITYLFPAIAYPRKHYRENLDFMQACTASQGRRPHAWLLYGLGLLVLAGLASHFLLSPLSRVATLPPPAPRPRPQQSAPRAPTPSPGTMTSPPYGQAYHDRAMHNAIPVQVSIRNNGFVPVEMTIAARWNKTTPLSSTRPAGIMKEPVYQGGQQMYGAFELGTMDNTMYPFVLDFVAGPHPELYFDTNHNGDLTDDGKPLTNQGSGIFATKIHIPFDGLIKEIRWPGRYTLWFFTNDSLWRKGAVAHYSRTQLKGQATINGRTYTAYIADAGDNDADFTNDGIAVDLNGNGKIDRQSEVFYPNKVARIENKDHAFTITW